MILTDPEMNRTLKILFVEDVESDAILIWNELKRCRIRFEKKLVETKEDYIKELRKSDTDIILSDFSLPQLDGFTALKIRNEICPDLPFILVTGSINDEVAVEIIKAGADDYIIKQNLSKLGPAINSTLQKWDMIRRHESTEKELKESEERFRKAVSEAPVPIMIYDEDDNILMISKGWTTYSGYSLNDIPTMEAWIHTAYGNISKKERQSIKELFTIDSTKENGVWEITTKDGSKRLWEFYTTPLGTLSKGKKVLHSMAIDITDQKRSETELWVKIEELEQCNDLTVGRELKMIELKKEINSLLKKLGENEKYTLIE